MPLQYWLIRITALSTLASVALQIIMTAEKRDELLFQLNFQGRFRSSNWMWQSLGCSSVLSLHLIIIPWCKFLLFSFKTETPGFLGSLKIYSTCKLNFFNMSPFQQSFSCFPQFSSRSVTNLAL